MKQFFLYCLLACSFFTNAQVTTTIDYSFETLGTSCNVFATNQTIDGYVHQATKGFPNFVGNPDYFINLQCRRNSATSQVGTEYQINFPFKKNHRYQINAYFRGTISSLTEFYPGITLALNTTKKTHNTSTSCLGPQSTSQSGLWFSGPSGPNFSWAASPMINSNPLPQDYESLTIGSIPWPGSTASGMQSIHVRKIQITEIAPVPPVTITNNTISFTTPFQYMEDISVTGSTPTVSSGTYTYQWVVEPWSMGTPQTATLNDFSINIFQGSSVVNSSYTLQRKVISSTGVESLSNSLSMPRPASSIVLNIDELPGNIKNGTKFVSGSTANFTLSNPIAGVKYVWYYYHRTAPVNSGFMLMPTPAVGTNYGFTVGNYFGFSSSPGLYDQLMVYGSDGSSGIYIFSIAP